MAGRILVTRVLAIPCKLIALRIGVRRVPFIINKNEFRRASFPSCREQQLCVKLWYFFRFPDEEEQHDTTKRCRKRDSKRKWTTRCFHPQSWNQLLDPTKTKPQTNQANRLNHLKPLGQGEYFIGHRHVPVRSRPALRCRQQ